MEHAEDNGTEWRLSVTEELVELGFKRDNILNPCDKPFEMDQKFNNERELFSSYRKNKDFDGLCESVKKIAGNDLRCCDRSDLVVAYFPERKFTFDENEKIRKMIDYYCQLMINIKNENDRNILSLLYKTAYEMIFKLGKTRTPVFGTLQETYTARDQKKPVMVVWEGDKTNCSGWLMWRVGHKNIFSSFDELFKRLYNIREGLEDVDEDWRIFR